MPALAGIGLDNHLLIDPKGFPSLGHRPGTNHRFSAIFAGYEKPAYRRCAWPLPTAHHEQEVIGLGAGAGIFPIDVYSIQAVLIAETDHTIDKCRTIGGAGHNTGKTIAKRFRLKSSPVNSLAP